MTPDPTQILNLDPTQVYTMIVGIVSLMLGTSVWKNIKQYLQIAQKDLHYVRDFVDMADNFAQDPTDKNWTDLWNKFATSVRSRVPATPAK
jgi:hypothetical protein